MAACAKGRQWHRALWLLDDMRRRGITASVVSLSTAISALARGKQWRRALALLQVMRSNGMIVDSIATNTAIVACGAAVKGAGWRRALALLSEVLPSPHAAHPAHPSMLLVHAHPRRRARVVPSFEPPLTHLPRAALCRCGRLGPRLMS